MRNIFIMILYIPFCCTVKSANIEDRLRILEERIHNIEAENERLSERIKLLAHEILMNTSLIYFHKSYNSMLFERIKRVEQKLSIPEHITTQYSKETNDGLEKSLSFMGCAFARSAGYFDGTKIISDVLKIRKEWEIRESNHFMY